MKDIINRLLNKFDFKLAFTDADTSRELESASIHRMGLELTGVKIENATSIIAWGTKENEFLSKKNSTYINEIVRSIITKETPLVFLSVGFVNNKEIINVCKETKTPLIVSDLHLTVFNIMVGPFLSACLAPSIIMHGSLVIVNGYGVVIKGKSGIGKSEAVLDLIKKGHSFVADDSIVLKRIGDRLYGESSKITKGFLEARGIGLINVPLIYGLKSVKDSTEILLIVELIDADLIEEVDRLGKKMLTLNILNSNIPKIELPIKMGRSTSVLIETAVEAFVARKKGMDPIKVINERGQK